MAPTLERFDFTDPDGNPFEITSYDYAALASKLTEQVARDER